VSVVEVKACEDVSSALGSSGSNVVTEVRLLVSNDLGLNNVEACPVFSSTRWQVHLAFILHVLILSTEQSNLCRVLENYAKSCGVTFSVCPFLLK